MKKVLVLGVGLLVALLLVATPHDNWPVPKEDSEKKNPVVVSSAVLKEAKSIYGEQCAMCHGDKGNGQGDAGAALSVQPADFTDAHMMGEATDGDLFYRMSEGRKPMPAYKGKYTDQQRWGLVHYLRTFIKKPPPKK